MSTERPQLPFIARTIRRLSLLVILAWVALTLIVTLAVPSLEQVGREHSVPLSPKDAPSVQAMMRMGKDFKESDSDSFAMIVLEGQQPLGDDAHTYYAGLVRELRDDPKHVEHVQDLWGDRLTAAGAQSADGKAAYVAIESGRQPRYDLGAGIRGGGPEYRRADAAASRCQGLCHRPGSARCGYAAQLVTDPF